MAYIDDLISRVADSALRALLVKEAARLRSRLTFGMVFERHIPERVALSAERLRVGSRVVVRTEVAGGPEYRIVAVTEGSARISRDGQAEKTVATDNLLLLQDLGEPLYPALVPLGEVDRGGGAPAHVVIEGENYHTLQLLTFLLTKAVDCIYIDPPYNTGARDWKYSNRFVDANDQWRHSKWLSMMERRLRLAGRLLKTDGVLIVTVDANEVHHLGLLLEQLFPAARRQVVTICINPSGASGEGLSRVDEYAMFCFFGNAEPVVTSDDMLTASTAARSKVRWEALMRGGTDWYRAIRRNLCYPVLLDAKGEKIVGVGHPLGDDVADQDRPRTVEGHPAAWPVRDDGRLGIWRVDGSRLMKLARKGYAYVSSEDTSRGTWTIRYLLQGTIAAIERGEITPEGHGSRGQVMIQLKEPKRVLAKTIWNRGRHTAGGAGGSIMLVNLLGERGAFPFPKSVYAVRDCLEVAVGNRKDAVILDYFAGSGTTLHSTCLMNADDGGSRQSILVTNNEVDAATTGRLARDGHYPGDLPYEAEGVFESVTRPRCEAAITGKRRDGSDVPGVYLDGRDLSEGFDANARFFRLDYLDRDRVELGHEFEAIVPALWLMAGGQGQYELRVGGDKPWSIPTEGTYGVLFDETKIRNFRDELQARPGIRRVFLVTDSQEAYAEMCDALGGRWPTSMLYRDYLRNFRVDPQELS